MNCVSGESQRIDATTQTNATELPPGRGGFQGYEVDCEKGRSIVVNCAEGNRVSFEPQPNRDRVVICVESIVEPCSAAATRSYTVNLTSPANSRFSASDNGSIRSSFGASFRDSDISLLSSYSERSQLQLSPDAFGANQSLAGNGLPGVRLSDLYDSESVPLERMPVGSTDSSERSTVCPLYCFPNGTSIRAIAGQINGPSQEKKRSVSDLILKKLNTYNPGSPPAWYKEQYNLTANWMWRTSLERINNCGPSFSIVTGIMLNCIAKWAGWTDEAGKCKKVVAESEACLDARFLLFLQNDINVFERLSEVSQTVACVERDICEIFQGKAKGDDIIVMYETLSFRSLRGRSRKHFRQSVATNPERYRAQCDAGVVFFFRELSQMIKEAESFEKYQSKRKEILAKCSRLGLLHMEKQSSKIALLIACINYNLAVYLIEKEYRQACLSEYDPARRVAGKLSVSTDYERFTDEDLATMRDLLKLLDALEQEVLELLNTFEKDINCQPRSRDGLSFEERVLHLSLNGGRYFSKPLSGIKATLLNILDKRLPPTGT